MGDAGTLDQIADALRRHTAALVPGVEHAPRAAVAVVLRDAPTLELLFIRRAEREGDPWSGQVALPGGRRDPLDLSLTATAVRETHEETGLALPDGALLGQLDELHPRTPHLPPIVVRPFVFRLDASPALQLSHEVAEAFWVPWQRLLHPDTSRPSTIRARGLEREVPSFVLGRHVVWGLTERILRNLIALVHPDRIPPPFTPP